MTRNAVLLFLATLTGAAVSADDNAKFVYDDLKAELLSDSRECAAKTDPDLVPDLDSGRAYVTIGWPGRPAVELRECIASKGWRQSVVRMVGGSEKLLTCRTPYHKGEDGPEDLRIMESCVHACARRGYHQVIYDAPPILEPKDPDDDIKDFVPVACR